MTAEILAGAGLGLFAGVVLGLEPGIGGGLAAGSAAIAAAISARGRGAARLTTLGLVGTLAFALTSQHRAPAATAATVASAPLPVQELAAPPPTPPPEPVQFPAPTRAECEALMKSKYADVAAWSRAFTGTGGAWAAAAEHIAAAKPPETLEAELTGVWMTLCRELMSPKPHQPPR